MSRLLKSQLVLLVLASLVVLATADPADAQRTRFLAFGDSITEAAGFDDCPCDEHECRQLCGYPRRLKNLLEDAGMDAGVLNFGLGGERTPEGLTRLDEVLEVGGDVLLLMEGTNDISRSISPETTIRNLEEMRRKATFAGLDTVHATLVPRFPNAQVDSDNVENARMAGLIRDLAFTGERRLVDPFEVFSRQDNLFEDFYADILDDPVGHPNARGFDLLAETFFNVLTNVDDVPPVLGPVTPLAGAEEVAPFASVRVRLYDFGTGIEGDASALFVNDEPVGFASSGGLLWQDLVFEPEGPLAGEVTARVTSQDLAGNTMDREATRFTVDENGPQPCTPDATTLCIDRAPGDERFAVSLNWSTALNGGQEGDALALPLASIGLRRGGLFSFFDPDNPEVLVKILDGCNLNGHFWVFVAPTTNLGFELRIVDTLAAISGTSPAVHEVVVTNPDGRDAPPVSDTMGFATCDL